MTPQASAQLFGTLFSMLGSDQQGEREAALNKIHSMSAQMGWPTFGDLRRKLESMVTLEQYERERDQWMQTDDDRLTEIAERDRRLAALSASNVSLRSALWFSINRGAVAGVAVAASLISGGWWWWSKAQAAPDPLPVAATDQSPRAIADGMLREVLSRARWGAGDTGPVIVRVNKDTDMWVVLRGTVDARSHSDARGRPIERHCLRLFAHEATRDGGTFITPSPYLAFGALMKWPVRAAECRMPGERNYE